MKIAELVKTYKLINDPNAPSWNIKFVGGLVVAGGILALAGAMWVVNGDAPEAAPAASTSDDSGAFVGPGRCDPDGAAQAWAAYQAEHPGAAGEPVTREGCVVGYRVR